MINYDEKMVLNSRLVIKMGIDQIGKNFVKSMSVKKFSYLGQFIQGLRTPGHNPKITSQEIEVFRYYSPSSM